MVVWVVLTLLLAPAQAQAVANYGQTTVSAGAWGEREKVGTGGAVCKARDKLLAQYHVPHPAGGGEG